MEENGGGVGKAEERGGGRKSIISIGGGGAATSLLARESSEDAQLNWEFAVRAQPPSAAPSERRLFCRSALHAQHPLAPPLPP